MDSAARLPKPDAQILKSQVLFSTHGRFALDDKTKEFVVETDYCSLQSIMV